MARWKQRAQWLLDGFTSSSKQTKLDLEALLSFANGDTTSPTITHWCLTSQANARPCCNTEEEARCKLISLLIPFFSRGYQTPLLYRMKHYAPASSFIKVGTCFFNVLPRALAEMDLPRVNVEDLEIADSLLADDSYSPEKDFQQILAHTLDCDQSYAAQNGLRRKLVSKEIGKPEFFKSAMIVDVLIQPLEYAINYMMGHTEVLHNLWFLGKGHPKSDDLLEKSRLKFLHVTSGKLADKVIQMYMTFLDMGLLNEINMGLEPTPTQLNNIFAMVVVCMSDVFRRFKFDFMVAPFKTFELLQCRTTQEFAHTFSILQAKFRKCPRCVDNGLTSALMTVFPDIASQTREKQESTRREVQSILNDLSGWTPTTSDMVELKNGQVQWSVSKRSSQNTKGIPSGMETTLIQSAIKQHQWAQTEVGSQTLPPKRVSSAVLKMVGTTGSNQHSSSVLPSVKSQEQFES